jgi:5'(3')-deoxyribonucleotidase
MKSNQAFVSSHCLRQYSIATEFDSKNIENQRCPEYALNWDHEQNRHHWEPGHDYFLGNGKNITDNLELRKILSEKLSRGTLPNKLVFCDLDGVLADFERGFINKFKKTPDEVNPSVMWSAIIRSNTFFETLPWMPKARELWEEIRQYDPIILTGIPRSVKAAEQKRKWCAKNLGSDIHVITCSTKDKPKFCLSGSLLIDDRTDNLNAWNSKGGRFILYDESFFENIVERIHKDMKNSNGFCTPEGLK